MHDFRGIAISYYKDFESHRELIGIFSLTTLALVLSATAFVIGFVDVATTPVTNDPDYSLPIYRFVVPLCLLMVTWRYTLRSKKQIAIVRLNERWGTNYKSYRCAQRQWLRRTIDLPDHRYCEVVEQISRLKAARSSFKRSPKYGTWKQAVGLAPDNQSKTRMSALLIFGLSLVPIVVFSGREHDPQQIIDVLMSEGVRELLAVLLVLSAITWATLRFIRTGIEDFITLATDLADSFGHPSPTRATDFLLEALINHHRVPRRSYRTPAEHCS